MIKLEGQEIRGVPSLTLHFSPQQEQYTDLGRAFSAFVKYIESNFSSLSGEISFSSVAPVKAPEKKEVKPIIVEKKKEVIATPEPEFIIGDILPMAEFGEVPLTYDRPKIVAVEEKIEEPKKAKKKKVDTKPSAI